jgi:hypothetical protein
MKFDDFFGLGEILNRIRLDLKAMVKGTIKHHLRRIRKRILFIAVQSAVLFLSLVFIVVGLVLFFSRFFSLDIILIGAGGILLLFVLILNMLK